jgi:cold shock CspA family protein
MSIIVEDEEIEAACSTLRFPCEESTDCVQSTSAAGSRPPPYWRLQQERTGVTIPPHENIVVSHQPSDDRSHVHVEVAIKDAFAAARRQIETLAQRASGKVKLHKVEAHGRVSKISAEEDYGFIATPDGREIYFHRNSVIDNAFDRLSVGSEVRFAEELGEKGAQASTVHLIGKHHLSEQNHRR